MFQRMLDLDIKNGATRPAVVMSLTIFFWVLGMLGKQ